MDNNIMQSKSTKLTVRPKFPQNAHYFCCMGVTDDTHNDMAEALPLSRNSALSVYCSNLVLSYLSKKPDYSVSIQDTSINKTYVVLLINSLYYWFFEGYFPTKLRYSRKRKDSTWIHLIFLSFFLMFLLESTSPPPTAEPIIIRFDYSSVRRENVSDNVSGLVIKTLA